MCVDKRLAGLQAVQTLSRLNRTHPFKEDTFVLDFVNDRQEIQEAFKVYYEGAQMGEEVEPARMYELKTELDASGIYLAEELLRFCEIFFKPKLRQSASDHKAMNAALDPAVDRFQALHADSDEDEAELWRGKQFAFRNLYAFLSQIIPYQDTDLERLCTFLRHLASKLPKRRGGPRYNFDDEVKLEYYRLQKISEGSISLKEGQAKPLDGPQEVGSGLLHEEAVALSRLIDLVNERFGTEFTEADQLFFDQIVEACGCADSQPFLLQNLTLQADDDALDRDFARGLGVGGASEVQQAHATGHLHDHHRQRFGRLPVRRAGRFDWFCLTDCKSN